MVAASFRKFHFIFVIMVVALAVPAFGQITLENADFEATQIADGVWLGIPAGWMGNGANEQNLTTSALNPSAQSGENICAFNQGAQIFQDLMEGGSPVRVQANKTYKVSVWVGRRAGNEGTFGGILEVYLQESANETRINQAIYDMDNPDQPRNSWTFQTFYLSTDSNPAGLNSTLQVGFQNISERAPSNQFWFSQVILDDVSVEGVQPIAINPNPTNGTLLNSTSVTIQWEPGQFATEHDIYLADNYDDVDNATSSDPMGLDQVYKTRQSATSFTAEGLMPSTTYYWRIDEVGGADIFKGDIWTFTIRPPTAYGPVPVDGAPFVDVNVELSWSSGTGAISHNVYFGDNLADVEAGTTDTDKGTVEVSSFNPGTLEYDNTYYWRIDENDGTNVHTGEIWTFNTAPAIPILDPSLVSWWKLDDIAGIGAFDSSGYGNHGTLYGGVEWVPGQIDGALDFDGVDGSLLDCGNSESLNITNVITLSTWVKTNNAGDNEDDAFITKGNSSYGLRHNTGNNIVFFINDDQQYAAGSQVFSSFNDTWHHVAGTYDGSDLKLYVDGELKATTAHEGSIALSTFSVTVGADAQQTYLGWYNGAIDDIRVYNRALSGEEVMEIVAGDITQAADPMPGYGSTVEIMNVLPLSWSAGSIATAHNVYLGTEKKAVSDADSTTAGIYRGQQSATTYSPAEGVEWGQTYYWRIDEVNNDNSISTGRTWTFSVADYLIVEDFEDYNDFPPDEIWNTWIDGYFVAANGSSAGYPDPDFNIGEHYLETGIVHGGDQSMPVFYDNSVGLSEVTKTLTSVKDWTAYNVSTLTLWFYGDAANAVEPMYVALNGNAVVVNDDANAALVTEWTQWDISLQEFADQGVNLANVNSMSIGFGNKTSPKVGGGSGHAFFDDIRLYK